MLQLLEVLHDGSFMLFRFPVFFFSGRVGLMGVHIFSILLQGFSFRVYGTFCRVFLFLEFTYSLFGLQPWLNRLVFFTVFTFYSCRIS